MNTNGLTRLENNRNSKIQSYYFKFLELFIRKSCILIFLLSVQIRVFTLASLLSISHTNLHDEFYTFALSFVTTLAGSLSSHSLFRTVH